MKKPKIPFYKLTTEEWTAVYDWANGAYTKIQELLRQGKELDDPEDKYMYDCLNAAFAKKRVHFEKGTTLYRAIFTKTKADVTLESKSYMAWTQNKDSLWEWTDNVSHQYIFVLRIKRGTILKAIDVNAVLTFMSPYPYQQEILMPVGTKLKIVRVLDSKKIKTEYGQKLKQHWIEVEIDEDT